MTVYTLVFYLFSLILVFSSFMVITLKNPIHSVLFLIFAFFNSAALFILLGAEFIAMLMVIVYVGAVAVLFLFVVMMLDIEIEKVKSSFVRYLWEGLLVLSVLFAELIFAFNVSLKSDVFKHASLDKAYTNNTESLGMVIYTDYIYPFQMSGLILLVAIIGSITLTLRVRSDVKKQDISKQVFCTKEDSVEIVKVKSREGVL